MTPAELRQLLITHAPEVPGITAAARRDDENPYGLTVSLDSGARAWWSITGASPAGTAPGSGPPGAGLAPVPVPDLTSRPVPVTAVEQALIATAVARAGGQVCSIDRYSTRPDPRAVRYGATIAFRDGWKLFLSCYGAPPAPDSHTPASPTTAPATSSLPNQPRHATRQHREAERRAETSRTAAAGGRQDGAWQGSPARPGISYLSGSPVRARPPSPTAPRRRR